MTNVLLVTSADLPDGEPDGHLLLPALTEHDIDARWVVWDDPDVDWAAADLVAVRSTWDYDGRLREFLGWARQVEESGTTLLNGADVFAWNTDKAYLVELASEVAVVPTIVVDGEEEIAPAIAEFGTAVVKPRVGAGGRGVVVFDLEEGGPPDLDESRLEPGPWVVQPLVESVRTQGETSVFVLGGRPVSQVAKLPAAGEIRVHEEYGGSSRPVPLDPGCAELAVAAVATASRLLGRELPYARADLMWIDGAPVVSELELVEPGLYLDVVPGNAEPFAELVAGLRG